MNAMRKNREKKITVAILCTVLVGLFAISGCDKLQRLHVDELTEACKNHTCIPLENTQWKLLGIVDKKANILTEFEPKDWDSYDNMYTLSFDTDSTFVGQGVINWLRGEYGIDCKTKNIHILVVTSTFANVLFDEGLYLELLNNVYSFSVKKDELLLYFNKSNYMLFKLKQ